LGTLCLDPPLPETKKKKESELASGNALIESKISLIFFMEEIIQNTTRMKDLYGKMGNISKEMEDNFFLGGRACNLMSIT